MEIMFFVVQTVLVLTLQASLNQGVSYSKKFCSKHGFLYLANNKTSQFVSEILNRVPKCKSSEIKI